MNVLQIEWIDLELHRGQQRATEDGLCCPWSWDGLGAPLEVSHRLSHGSAPCKIESGLVLSEIKFKAHRRPHNFVMEVRTLVPSPLQ